VPSSRTTFSVNASRFLIASATPTDYGKLSTFLSMDFFGQRQRGGIAGGVGAGLNSLIEAGWPTFWNN
jgi:hypothetical protein